MASPELSLIERRARVGTIAPHIAPVTTAGDHLLPVVPALASLLPRAGLQRGTVVSLAGSGGALSLAFAVCAAASAEGSWLAVVGTERLGLAAVDELGVHLDRLVLVDAPPAAQWGTVVATLVDAFDLVLVVTREPIDAVQARRLTAKARERGTVILQVGRWAWPDAPDVRLDVIECRWDGLGEGHGTLTSRQITVTAVNRRDARPRRKSALWLPDTDGAVRCVAEAGEGETNTRGWAGSDIDELIEVTEPAAVTLADAG
jgi:hypothetical protein